MIRRVRNFVVLPWGRKLLLLEAAQALVSSWWTVRQRPFHTYVATLGQAHQGEFIDKAKFNMAPQLLGQVRWALNRLNKLVGGRFTCLMLAIAGKRLLNRHGLSSTLVLGVRLDKGDGDDPFGAHAWLRAGQYVVVGLEERAGHIPVASYHSEPSDLTHKPSNGANSQI